MRVSPPSRYSTVRDTSDGLQIVIPAKRKFFVIVVLSAWLVGWAAGETFAIRHLFFGDGSAPYLFLTLWLVVWTIGGGWVLYIVLWNLVGKEVVALLPGTLSIKRDVLGFGRTREYDLGYVRNLRTSPQVHDPFGWGSSMRVWGLANGAVAFDYGAKTFRFGSSIDEAEGAEIVRELKARHSFEGAA